MASVYIACDMPQSFLDGLKKLGYDCAFEPEAGRAEVMALGDAFRGWVVSTKTIIDEEVINTHPSLRFIARAGSGMETINWKYANEHDIVTINSPEGNCDAVGEHALGMLLSLFNNLNKADREVRTGKWLREENRGVEIKEKTVGIIGYGHTGPAFARKLSGLDAHVMAYDKYRVDYSDEFAQEATMAEIFADADVLSLHIPLTNETRQLIDAEFVSRFRKPFYFINTARGGCMNTGDVVAAMQSGKILGACLDVMEDEVKPQQHDWFAELVQRDNVIFTPHVAGWTRESRERIGQVLLAKIAALGSP